MTSRRRRLAPAALTALATLLLATSCLPFPGLTLTGLPVPTAGYDRSCGAAAGCVFGPAWNDPNDHSGCDTRNRILARDLHDVTYKAGTRPCKVTYGLLDDPYTGRRNVPLTDVQIDHVVPLRLAWDRGANQWSPAQRIAFANDPLNLIATTAEANRAKSDHSPAHWMPNTGRCRYSQTYLQVSRNYHIPLTPADTFTLRIALTTCP